MTVRKVRANSHTRVRALQAGAPLLARGTDTKEWGALSPHPHATHRGQSIHPGHPWVSQSTALISLPPSRASGPQCTRGRPMPPQRACERTPHGDWHSLGGVSDARSLQAPREGPLEGCMRSHHWQLHVRPPQKESQTLRGRRHVLAQPRTLFTGLEGPCCPHRGARGSQACLVPHGALRLRCERLHQNLSPSKQALTARRHLLTACGASWLQADTLSGTQLCSWQTAGPCQRLSISNRSLGASTPHSGNSHTASDFFLVIVMVLL